MENNKHAFSVDMGGFVSQSFEANYKTPLFIKEKSKAYVNYGEDNLYPQYLVEIYNRSAKHNAIIQGKTTFIHGGGVKIKPEKGEIKGKLAAQKMLDTPNAFETLDEIYKKLVADKELYGGYAVQFVWNMSRDAWSEVYHVDFAKLRVSEDGKTIFYSEDWSAYRPKIKSYPAFNPNSKTETQIMYYKEYRPHSKVYPLPTYVGAVPYIEVDIEIASFHRNNLKNGFFFGGMVSFNNGEPETAAQKDEIVKSVTKRHQGSEQTGRWIVTFNDGKDRAPEVDTFEPSDLDKQFEALNKQVLEELFVGHRVTSPMFFGIRTAGQLGGRTEMVESFKLFEKNYTKPQQDHFAGLFNYMAKMNDAPEIFYIEPLDMPSPELSETTMLATLSKDEIREMLGYAPVDTSTNALNDKLNTLSPLVANNVLSNLTINEKRSIIGLPAIPDGDKLEQQIDTTKDKEVAQQMQKFSFTDLTIDEEIAIFSQFGSDAAEYEEVKSIGLAFGAVADSEIENVLESASVLLFADQYKELDETQRKAIEFLKANPEATKKQLSTELGLTDKESEKVVKTLEKGEYLSYNKGVWNITALPPAKTLVDKIIGEAKKFEVKYRYSGAKDSKNRDFCAALLKLEKLYSKEEISTISKRVGRNVWRTRGGWQTVAGTDTHLPFCRHTWLSVLVKKK